MPRRQLFALFSNGMISSSIGYAFGAIIPIYIARIITDDASIIGIYLALTYLTYSIGVLVGGWFSDRFPQRRIHGLLMSIVIRALFFGVHGTDRHLLPHHRLVHLTADIRLQRVHY